MVVICGFICGGVSIWLSFVVGLLFRVGLISLWSTFGIFGTFCPWSTALCICFLAAGIAFYRPGFVFVGVTSSTLFGPIRDIRCLVAVLFGFTLLFSGCCRLW